MPRQINRTQDITFNITHHFGVLDTSQSGWTKEVNLVEWNGKPEKLDIREWDPEHEHMSRGVTLRKNETLTLLDILYRNFGEELKTSRSFNSQPQVEDSCSDENCETNCQAEDEACAPDEEGIASSEQF